MLTLRIALYIYLQITIYFIKVFSHPVTAASYKMIYIAWSNAWEINWLMKFNKVLHIMTILFMHGTFGGH